MSPYEGIFGVDRRTPARKVWDAVYGRVSFWWWLLWRRSLRVKCAIFVDAHRWTIPYYLSYCDRDGYGYGMRIAPEYRVCRNCSRREWFDFDAKLWREYALPESPR